MTLRIALRGEPRHRTGTLHLCGDRHELATWYRAADGVTFATTDTGVQIVVTAGAPGCGLLSMSGRHWHLSDIVRDGDVIVGEAREGVSDGAMAGMFPGGEWGG